MGAALHNGGSHGCTAYEGTRLAQNAETGIGDQIAWFRLTLESCPTLYVKRSKDRVEVLEAKLRPR